MNRELVAEWVGTAPLDEIKGIITLINTQYKYRLDAEPRKLNKYVKVYTVDVDAPDDEAFFFWYYTRFYCRVMRIHFSRAYQRSKRSYMQKNYMKPCYKCGRRLKRSVQVDGERVPDNIRTIDHIIPAWLVKLCDRLDLILDERNFAMCCSKCNGERGNELKTIGAIRQDIGDKVVDKILAGAGLDLPDDFSVLDIKGNHILW